MNNKGVFPRLKTMTSTGGLTLTPSPVCLYVIFASLPLAVSQGPHIASVTLAAYECGSVDFPEPPYPDQIICPQQEAAAPSSDAEQVGLEPARVDSSSLESAALHGSISLWTIMSKVRLEACLWVSACHTLLVVCTIHRTTKSLATVGPL